MDSIIALTANSTSRCTSWDCFRAIRSINSDFVISPFSPPPAYSYDGPAIVGLQGMTR